MGNKSSGRTSARLADELSGAGHKVTWLGAEDAIKPTLHCEVQAFQDFEDLALQLKTHLATSHYDMVIHAAAVSDFNVASILSKQGEAMDHRQGKLSSESDMLLQLKRNPKLLDQIKGWSKNPKVSLVGFKLTDTGDLQLRLAAIKKQFDDSKVDAVVHNDLSDMNDNAHPFCLYRPGKEPVRCVDGEALAITINNMVETIA